MDIKIHGILNRNEGANNEFDFGFFLIILMEKYHIICHKVAESMRYNLFRKENNNYTVIVNYATYKEEIVRCQRVFTFTRLMAKYYPEFYSNQNYSNLIQILSYLRRGYTFSVMGEYEKAFNDYTHTQKLLKEIQNDRNDICNEYKEVLDPVCLGLKGECYQQDYAYDSAFQYYCNSVNSFKELSKKFAKEWNETVLKGSFRLVLVKINKAKMFLEMGEFRRSLKWFCRALQQVIELFQNNINENVEYFNQLKGSLDELITYLDNTKYDPYIRKFEICEKIEKLTDNLEKFKIKNESLLQKKCKGSILLSDICNRISIILYLIHFPLENEENSKEHDLSYRWLKLSLEFDSANGLAHYNKLVYGVIAGNDENLPYINSTPSYDYKEIRHEGSFFDRWTRHFAITILRSVKKNVLSPDDGNKKITSDLLSRLLLYTDNFSLKNKEIFRYLTKDRIINDEKYKKDEVFFYILRRWSSYTPSVPRPSAFYSRGGGYFIIHNNKGIAIDPGFDFVLNLYQEGFSIDDIDAVIITHDHIDHYANFDYLLSLWNYRKEIDGICRKRELFLNCGVMERYGFLLRDIEHYNVYPLRSGSVVKSEEQGYMFNIRVKRAIHKELSTEKYSVGFIIQFYHGTNDKYEIGFTGDTAYDEKNLKEYLTADILVVNINNFPFRELKHILKLYNEGLDEHSKDLKALLEKFDDNNNDKLKNIANQIRYAYWYNNKKTSEKNNEEEGIFTPPLADTDYKCLRLGEHLFLRGVLAINKSINEQQQNNPKPQLIFISELREEIGSFRNKLATFINEENNQNNKENKVKYLTADIGISARLIPEDKNNPIRVACSKCKLSNDSLFDDIYHIPSDIIDFCIKGEDEGIFCLCRKHNTTDKDNDRDKELFFQRIERYNIFGRVSVRP
ncbi:MAG: MBL fold metallo-hydrolase [Candidatus Brocadiales bacterium]|nr:MBL fold metallo-hydrolase [Candidatus Brocadiales bacterium]